MKIIKKTVRALIACCFLICIYHSAKAELSTNLQTRTVYNPHNPKLINSVTYINGEGAPEAASDKGYATIQYTYGTRSMVTKVELLDASGEIVNGAEGWAVRKTKYSFTKVAEQSYFDKDGNAVIGPEGYARLVSKYKDKKLQSTWEYDPDGNPINTHRICEYKHIWKKDRIVKDGWYDVDGNPAPGPEGYACVEYQYAGRKHSYISYTGADGNPFYNSKAKYATMEALYEQGRIRDTRYYGADGELIPGPSGYAYVIYTYPTEGTVRREMYYNADGSLFFTTKGYCGYQRELGIRNRIMDEQYFVDEELRGITTDGYSRVSKLYTKTGRVSYIRYYDDKDQPMIPEKYGYSAVRYTYENGKRITREDFYDEAGNPMTLADGYASIVTKYKDRLATEMKYLDASGKKQVNHLGLGYARVTYTHDKTGNVIAEHYYDAEGNPTSDINGADETRFTWSEKDRTTESYWKDGNPVCNSEGVHLIRSEYNGNHRVIKKSYFDTDMKPVNGREGYAVTVTEYNSQGTVMSTRYYDRTGQLIQTPGRDYAYMRTMLFKDLEALGETRIEVADPESIEEALEDEAINEDGTPVMLNAFEVTSESGSIVEYYGTDDQLMEISSGYAAIIRETNERGLTTSETYLGVDRNPVMIKSGYSTVRKEYDQNGKVCQETYFGTNGEKVLRSTGYHMMKQKNDVQGNPLSVSYYGIEGEPVLSTSKYHRIDKTYLDRQHVLSEAWFDENNAPLAPRDTYVSLKRVFDHNKDNTEISYYDPNGNPIACRAGYDTVKNEYGAPGVLVRTSYWKSGELVLSTDGYAIIEMDYDDAGNLIQERYLDENQNPVNSRKGYSQIIRTYDQDGALFEEKYYDSQGNDVPIETKKAN